MASDPKPIASHDAEIAAALAELRAARGNFDHSPNSDNEYWITQAERRLNTLLDRRARIRAAEADVADQLVK